MFGFMAITSFLSMWLSNTATTGMLLPIVQAVIEKLRQNRTAQNSNSTGIIFSKGPLATYWLYCPALKIVSFHYQ